MILIAIILLVVATIWIFFRLYLSYTSFGGTVEVVTRDAVLYPPIMATIGVYLLMRAKEVDWSIWLYVGICVGLGVLVLGALKLAEEIGDTQL